MTAVKESDSDKSLLRPLTSKEASILAHAASGWFATEIAVKYGIHPDTVTKHNRRILQSTGGRTITHAAVIALRRGELRTEHFPPGVVTQSEFTDEEMEILTLVAEGLTDTQICAEAESPQTRVHYVISLIHKKLGTSTRGHMVSVAYQRGILP